MKILWITNTVFPEPAKILGLSEPVLGGWMYSLAQELIKHKEIELAIASIYSGKSLKLIESTGIRYYLLPGDFSVGYQQHLELIWHEIISEYKPSIVHIHGTEYQHGLAFIRACKSQIFVISIQGLVGVIARYFYAGLSVMDIINNLTIRDLLRMDTLVHRKNKYIRQGIYENEYIINGKHIIGRTEWDYAHVKAINPLASYYHCEETLRDGFYFSKKWNPDTINKNTVFLSQAKSPIKGMHQALKAVAMLVNDFPKIKVRVAGDNILSENTFVKRMKTNGYSSYIKKLITRLGLTDNIEFVGPLSEEGMINEYLNANVFICPSSIENSSNSIGEAQILGVPTIASCVGGTQNMIKHGETGLLYRFEEFEMLAENIKKIFIDNRFAKKISVQGIAAAEKRHDRNVNCDQILRIYRDILT